MSDYVKSTDFATKDGLTTGNPLKVVKGAEIDTEFTAIETAVASKVDESREGAASGIATLDGSATIPLAQLPTIDADTLDGYEGAEFGALAENETVAGDWTFTGAVTFSGGGAPALLAFSTIDCQSGTDPIADSAADTLRLESGNSAKLTVTGDSSTDTIVFALTAIIPTNNGSNNWSGANDFQGTTTFTAATVEFSGADGVTFNNGAWSTEDNASISTNVLTLDTDLSNSFDVDLTDDITTLTLVDMNDGQGIDVLFRQHASAAKTVAFPATWRWAGGTEGVISATLSSHNILSLKQFNSVVYASLIIDFAVA